MERVYKTCGEIIAKARQRKGTVKSMCLTSKCPQKKKLLALVCESLKYGEVIRQILTASDILKREPKLSPALLTVLVYDHLFGRGIQCGGSYKKLIQKYKIRLNSELAKLKAKYGVKNNEDLLPESIRNPVLLPRYVRVNVIKIGINDAIKRIQAAGFNLLPTPECAEELSTLPPGSFCRDQHLPEVLAFAPNTDLHDNQLYADGLIILQDKASCFPAFVLNPPEGSVCIDGCAAPGNKTSHLAARMNNIGRVIACDLSLHRLNTMKHLLSRAGAECVEPLHGSFLDLDPTDNAYSDVTHILLDPTCSGSGIVSRLEDLLDTEDETGLIEQHDDADRLQNLAAFQTEVVLHAMKFPSLQRLTYSTCSIHEEENEKVVTNILAQQDRFVLETALPSWPHRGLSHDNKLVRADAKTDRTNGFFVALFVRTGSNNSHAVNSGTTKKRTGNGRVKKKKKKRQKTRTTLTE